MSTSKCYYHPNIEGIYRCPICNKDICAQCKKIYGEISRSEGTQVVIEHEMCPVCYWEHRIMEIKSKASIILKKNISILLSVVLIFVDIVVSYLIFTYFSQYFYVNFFYPFLPVLSIQIFFGIGLLLLKRLRNEPSEISSYKYHKEKFLERSFTLQNYLMQNT